MQPQHSKTHTVLLLVLVLMAGVIIGLLLADSRQKVEAPVVTPVQNPVQTPAPVAKDDVPTPALLQFCPDEKISNQMPTFVDPSQPADPNVLPRDYYVYKEKRYEISDFDATWVKNNCTVKEQIVR